MCNYMTRKIKILTKFLNNPTSVHFTEIAQILNEKGFVQVSVKGSHCKFKHPRLTADLIIPVHNGDCKDFYKKQVVKTITSL